MNPLPSCHSVHRFGVETLRLGFVACSADCHAASFTDAALACHALFHAFKVWSYGRTGGGSVMHWAAFATLLSNGLWSTCGAVLWLQPGGSRAPPFETLFRLNGGAQALLVGSWWCVLAGMLGGLASVPRVLPAVLYAVGAAHALAFALRNLEASFESYVLCGGANVTPPLSSIWLLLVLLCRRHELLSRWLRRGEDAHPLLVGALSGLVFWFGNSGLLMGAETGLTYWTHAALEALCRAAGLLPEGARLWQGAFEEMACFHLFGLLGNEMLFRVYRWLAAAEVDAIRRAATPTRVCNRNGKARARSIGPWLTEALHAGSRKQE